MTYVPTPGGTLLVPSGTNLHLFVIVTKTCQFKMHFLLSITTIYPNKYHDPTCTFDGGEHSFIAHPSYVLYRQPEQRSASHIVKMVNGGIYVPRETLGAKYFKRICDGIQNSPTAKPFLKHGFRDNPP